MSMPLFDNQTNIKQMVGSDIDTMLLDDETPNNMPILILSYDASCPVCVKMAPEFISLSKMIKDQNIPVNIVAINVQVQPEKIEQLHLEEGLPNIRLYRGNNHYTEFGKEEYSHLKKWNLSEMTEFLKENNVSFPK